MKMNRPSRPLLRCAALAIILTVLCGCSERAEISDGKLIRYHRDAVAALDREIANHPTDERSRALLKGLRWCVLFCDDDENFDATFTNYIKMLDEMTHPGAPSPLTQIVHDLILRECERVLPRLPRLLTADAAGYERFISILPVLYHHKVPIMPFKEFAERHFAGMAIPDRLKEFRRATKTRNYDRLTDWVLGAAFTDMAYHWGADKDFHLPPNHLTTILAECMNIPFTRGYKDGAYHAQNYYATHVILALNHYGQRPLIPSSIGDKVFLYLLAQYDTVRHRTEDLDLLCEYLYCFKQFGLKGVRFITEGEQYVLSLQRRDGSWGSDDDLDGTPYDRLHPTWTAITLLVQ